MATSQTMFVHRADLSEVVEDLLDSYHRDEDEPADHECDTHGRACTHGRFDHRPLVARLVELSMPSQSMLRDNSGGKKAKAPVGSPAPWSPGAAELLDEMYRGAVAMVSTARQALGFGELHVRVDIPPYLLGGPLCEECRHTSCDAVRTRWVPASLLAVDVAGPKALRQLPDLLAILQGRADLKEHELVTGRRGIDRTIRGWHARAQKHTGHEQQWARVGQFEDDKPPPPRQGPTCAISECDHPSCRMIRLERKRKWRTARCPYCHSVSLRQDPVSGDVWCIRPSCKDSEGRRHVWAKDQLGRLGAIVTREAAS